MRQKLKRFMSFIMALLIVVSSVSGSAMTAFAASAEANISFWYASASEHGVVSEFNSSHTGQILYAMIDGKIGYCLNFGLTAETGELMKSDDEPNNTSLSAKQEKLLAASSSGKNEAARGFMGRIRAFFDPLDWADAPMNVNPEAMNQMTSWSMNAYRQMVKEELEQDQEGAAQAWDELEKSVVSKIADDVKVRIQGRRVEMIILKKVE